MSTVDAVKANLLVRLNAVTTTATPEQLAYVAKALNSIEPPFTWFTITSNTTAQNFGAYFCDTLTTGPFTLTLPSTTGLSAGQAKVIVSDLRLGFGSNVLTLNAGGNKILNQTDTVVVNTSGAAMTLVWSGNTYGWQFLVQG